MKNALFGRTARGAARCRRCPQRALPFAVRSASTLAVAAFFLLAAACGSSQSESTTRTEPTASDPQPAPSDPADPEPASEGQVVVGTDACTTDADCVPASCCHPTACVAVANRPSCGDSVCTSDCRYGTLDCGGACLCQAGHCAARLSTPPVIPGTGEVQ